MKISHLAFASLALALLALPVHFAQAAGYAIEVPSSAALGNSYAGQATGAHDISDMFVNPAILTEFPNRQIISNNMLLDYGIKIGKNSTAKTALGTNADLVGNASAGMNGGDTIYIPAVYFSEKYNHPLILPQALPGQAYRQVDFFYSNR